MDAYTRTYIRLLRCSRSWRYLPWSLKYRIGALMGRYGSFLLHRTDQIVASMQVALGIDRAAAEQQFRLLCENSGVAMQMAWQLADTPSAWFERYIRIEQPHHVQSIGKTGAVILSHHSYHQNLLISYFKTTGLASYPVGNPPTAFSEDDYLYRFTLYLNQSTATNLNGGEWLYNDQGRAFLLGIRHALESRQILLVFCDFNEPKKSNPVYPFLGKQLQIPGGVIRLVEKESLPVYFAGFSPQSSGRYALSLEPLHTGGGTPPLAQQYLQALERHVRRFPAAWQCWEIF